MLICVKEVAASTPAISERSYTAGSYIFHEGDPATVLYIIVRGQVKISRLGSGGTEAVLRVFLDTSRTRATGYRLYLFYPS